MAGSDDQGKGSKDKDKKNKKGDETVVDLAARIGSRAPEPAAPTEKPSSPLPGPSPQVDAPLPRRLDGPLPSRRASDRPALIGADEPTAQFKLTVPASEIKAETAGDAIASPRSAPAAGEMDIVVTPLPTPDDWHRFELALRRVRGVTHLRPEYYRHGVAKMRVQWEGKGRLAQALRAGIPGYRVRVIGEDRGTIQILVSSDNEERRPG